MAKAIAPDADFSFINRIASRVRARHLPARPKREQLMGDELAQLGYDLMQSASELSGIKAAVQYRDGLLLLLLVHVPLRRKNFADLTIGRTLVHRQGQWFVTLTPDETKTHAHYEVSLAPDLVRWLEDYIARCRPLLEECCGRWQRPINGELFLSNHGSPLTQMALYDRVRKRTLAKFGIAINPHQFRDIAASTIASHAPAHVHAAAPLLGHASLQTTEKYYRIAKAQEGQRRYIDILQEIRSHAHG